MRCGPVNRLGTYGCHRHCTIMPSKAAKINLVNFVILVLIVSQEASSSKVKLVAEISFGRLVQSVCEM